MSEKEKERETERMLLMSNLSMSEYLCSSGVCVLVCVTIRRDAIRAQPDFRQLWDCGVNSQTAPSVNETVQPS